MALHIGPELWEKYGAFYLFALGGEPPEGCACLSLTDPDDAALAAAVAKDPGAQAVSIRGGRLTTLAPLEFLPRLTWVRAVGCARLAGLWQMGCTPALRGVALARCAKVRDLAAFSGAPGLEHLYLQCGAWDAAVLDSVAPLAGLSRLRTLDLAYKSVRDRRSLAFRTLYPQLDSLTITPGLRKAFRTGTEV